MTLSDVHSAFASCELDIKKELQDKAFADSSLKATEDRIRNLLSKWPTSIKSRLLGELFGHGPLESYLEKEEIKEILIMGPDKIVLESSEGWVLAEDGFLSSWTFRNWVQRLSQEASMKTDWDQCFADGNWRNFRLHIAQAPLCSTEFHISMRRHPHKNWTLEELEAHSFLTAEQSLMLQSLVQEKKNILFIGGTGSGKTSLLGACLEAVSASERVVLLEDTQELKPPNAVSTSLLTRVEVQGGLRGYSLSDLLRQSLRMHPDRLVVGEVRGGEAKDLLLALSTGHDGSFGTLHANQPHEALFRLEFLIQMGAPQWQLESIRRLIFLTIHNIVVVKKTKEGRRLEGIYKICSLEKSGMTLEKMNIKGSQLESKVSYFPQTCTSR